jgi:uncharacterized RDD family membrane protein YckC
VLENMTKEAGKKNVKKRRHVPFTLAEPNHRLVSGFIDTILIALPIVTLVLPISIFSMMNLSPYSLYGANFNLYNAIYPQHDMTSRFLIASIMFVIIFLYSVVIPAKVFNGQTIGKKIIGLKVVKENTKYANIADFMNRTFFALLLSLLMAFPIFEGPILFVIVIFLVLNCYSLYIDSRHQTIFDKIAKTIVIEEKV